MKLDGYPLRPGAQWETAGLRNILEYVGVKLGPQARPPSEAWVIGLAGGVSAGWSMDLVGPDDERMVTLGFRHDWHKYRGELAEAVCARLLLPLEVRETGSPKLALGQLASVLGEGMPAWCLADEATFRHTPPGARLAKACVYGVAVYGLDDDVAHVDDRCSHGWQVPVGELAAARAAIAASRHRIVIVRQPSRPLDLAEAVQDAVAACRERSQHAVYGVSAWRRWADALADAKDASGWMYQLVRSADAVQAFRSTYLQLAGNSEGAGLRELYAEFLTEAGAVVSARGAHWAKAADRFREAAALWRHFGDLLLPDTDPALRDLRTAIARTLKIRRDRGTHGLPELVMLHERIRQAHLQPAQWDRRTMRSRLEDLAGTMRRIHDVERAAFELL
ncbi:MAG: DUF4872 domain-containing protein [Myxococcales bacterium]|nr:DUF4872 domain-containing protein [Myxococcales bacterium]